MAQYDTYVPCYDEDEMFHERDESVTDLHAYYMSQFNLELENGNKTKKNDHFKHGIEESFDFEVLDNWSTHVTSNTGDFEMINEVIDTNINEQNIKDVLLDLDSIDFDEQSPKECNAEQTNSYENNTDYIDDESLIDELCREDHESCRLTPDFNEEYLPTVPSETNILPSIETAFSKRYCNYNIEENNLQDFDINDCITTNNNAPISSVEHYSYPNSILYNLGGEKSYILPDTPTSCNEFNFNRHERKISISESIDSDVQSSIYYDENSESFEEEDLFVNLDDFGLTLESDNDDSTEKRTQNQRKADKDVVQGDRVCLWENCFERYPNQSTLVEHIERAHVNTYKGDEFSCLWRDCARARRPFNARYKLLIHMRVHSGHKPNRCHHPGCGKAFSRLENLKIHVRSHTGERPYACPAPHCRKAFSNSSDRAKHQRTHFNARPYACGAIGCGKRYTDPSSLRKHVKSHPHITNVPRTCLPPSRPIKRTDQEQLVPTSPAKLTTLRCIRDKLTIPRLQRL